MKKIVLITEQFPYSLVNETFLENEIIFWSENRQVSLTILPQKVDDVCRDIPENIDIDLSLSNYLLKNDYKLDSNIYKIIYGIKSFTKSFFVQELFSKKITNIAKFKSLLYSMRKYFIYEDFFKQYKNGYANVLFYTYWHNEITYVLQHNSKTMNSKVVTRTHRYDLYEETTFVKYMPLRRQFKNHIEKIFTITNSATDYIVQTYGFKRSIIETSPLGVRDRKISTRATNNNTFHVVSCSGIREVKRVDKIIEILYLLSQRYKNINFYWTHIGDGSLRFSIEERTKKRFEKISNITYSFLGNLSNQEVFEFYKNNKIDIFINTSKSEGVPVSIMEAMSCHIPIVAPNVGGVSDMIKNGYNGYLLSSDFSIDEAVEILSKFEIFKSQEFRENSYQMFLKKYDANVNYKDFIEKLLKIETNR